MKNLTNIPSEQPKKHRAWAILRWIPVAVLLTAALLLAIMYLRGGLMKITAWYLADLLPVVGLACLVAVGIYAAVKRHFSRAMLATVIISVLALLPVLLLINPPAYPASIDTEKPAATVRLPADQELTVVWGGDTKEVNNHVSTPDQRWAYDFLATPYFSNSTRLEDYGCYGMPVVAPAAGSVSIAHDGEPDGTPTILPNVAEMRGNFVAIKMETGTYLLIAHLKPGSVVVKTGETVKEGQVIGQCGNSGHSSEPHIHIHHQRQDPAQYPLNFAEGLPLYFRDHNGPPMPVGGVKVEGNKAYATGAVVRHNGK